MSFLSRIFGTRPPPPRMTPPRTPLSPPRRGTIVKWSVVDGTGAIDAEGETLRFGRASSDFEPIEGTSVEVHAVEPHPLGGLRAARVTVAADARDAHDRALEARDAVLVPPAKSAPVTQGASDLFEITLLLREPLDTSRAGLRRFFEAAGVAVEQSPSLLLGEARVQAFPLAHALPSAGLDTRHAKGPIDWGASAVHLGLALRLRAPGLHAPSHDTLSANGHASALVAVMRPLLAHATGVVLHAAGQVFREAAWMAAVLARAEERGVRPFAPLVDLGFDGAKTHLASWGMRLFELPDVAVRVADSGSDAEYELAQDAVLAACAKMADAARRLEDGELVRAPRGFDPVAARLDEDAPDSVLWRATLGEDRIELARAE